jgi:hypothetical protein
MLTLCLVKLRPAKDAVQVLVVLGHPPSEPLVVRCEWKANAAPQASCVCNGQGYSERICHSHGAPIVVGRCAPPSPGYQYGGYVATYDPTTRIVADVFDLVVKATVR